MWFLILFIAGFVIGVVLGTLLRLRSSSPPSELPPAVELLEEVEKELNEKMGNDLERRTALEIIDAIRERRKQ